MKPDRLHDTLLGVLAGRFWPKQRRGEQAEAPSCGDRLDTGVRVELAEHVPQVIPNGLPSRG